MARISGVTFRSCFVSKDECVATLPPALKSRLLVGSEVQRVVVYFQQCSIAEE